MRLISKIKLISNKTTYWKIQASAKNFFILLALLNLDNFEQWSWGCFYVKKQKRHTALYLQLHNKALCSILPPLKGTSIRHWLEWLQDQAANLLCDLYFIVTHLSVQGKPRMCLGVFFFPQRQRTSLSLNAEYCQGAAVGSRNLAKAGVEEWTHGGMSRFVKTVLSCYCLLNSICQRCSINCFISYF